LEHADLFNLAINELKFLEDTGSKINSEFQKFAIKKTISKGEFISLEGDSCNYMAIVLSGRVRVYKVSETGREITLYHLEKGEGCILTASCILSKKNFPAISIADEEVEVIIIPSQIFRDWMEKYDSWRKYIFELLSKRLALVISVVEEVAFKRMDTRIAEYLLSNLPKNSRILKITHHQIADELGTSREVVSRILKDIENGGLISMSRGIIQIEDVTALNNKSKYI
jgi:CRP/FNR family transcriptional regulator, anaerobic regulatory protein